MLDTLGLLLILIDLIGESHLVDLLCYPALGVIDVGKVDCK